MEGRLWRRRYRRGAHAHALACALALALALTFAFHLYSTTTACLWMPSFPVSSVIHFLPCIPVCYLRCIFNLCLLYFFR